MIYLHVRTSAERTSELHVFRRFSAWRASRIESFALENMCYNIALMVVASIKGFIQTPEVILKSHFNCATVRVGSLTSHPSDDKIILYDIGKIGRYLITTKPSSWLNVCILPDSNENWPNVGPTSGRQYRRWANVGPTYNAVWALCGVTYGNNIIQFGLKGVRYSISM